VMTNLITVRDYLRLIFRRKFALLPPVGLALVAIIPLWILVPTRYRAEALIKRQEPGMVSDATGAKIRSVGTSLKTLRVEILTWDNLDRVIRQLKMDRSLRTPADWQRQYKKLREDIAIRLLARGNNTDLIEISAIADTPEAAMEITNAIADNYVEASKRSGRRDSENAVDFLRQRARDTLEKLQAVEHKLALYREQHLSTVPEVRQQLVEKIAALKTQLASKRYQVAALTTRLEQVVKRMKDTPKTVVHEAQVEDNQEYVRLANEIKARKEMLDRALLTYREEHPDMVVLRREIKRMEKKLAQLEATVTAEVKKESSNPFYEALLQERISLGQEIKTAESMIVRIQADIAAHELQAGKIVKKEKSWNDLLRARAEYESQYARYSSRLEAAETQFDVATSRFRLYWWWRSNGCCFHVCGRVLRPFSPGHRRCGRIPQDARVGLHHDDNDAGGARPASSPQGAYSCLHPGNDPARRRRIGLVGTSRARGSAHVVRGNANILDIDLRH